MARCEENLGLSDNSRPSGGTTADRRPMAGTWKASVDCPTPARPARPRYMTYKFPSSSNWSPAHGVQAEQAARLQLARPHRRR